MSRQNERTTRFVIADDVIADDVIAADVIAADGIAADVIGSLCENTSRHLLGLTWVLQGRSLSQPITEEFGTRGDVPNSMFVFYGT